MTGTRPQTLIAFVWPAASPRAGAARDGAVVAAGLVAALLAQPFGASAQAFVLVTLASLGGARIGLAGAVAAGAASLAAFPAMAGGALYALAPLALPIGFAAAGLVVGYLADRGWSASPWLLATMTALGHAIILLAATLGVAASHPPLNAAFLVLAPAAAATLGAIAAGVALVAAGWRVARLRAARRRLESPNAGS